MKASSSKRRGFVARSAVTIFAAAAVLFSAWKAEADHLDFDVWRESFGASQSQSAEILLDNSRCAGYAKVRVVLNHGEGLREELSIELAPGASQVRPISFRSPSVGRRHVAATIFVSPGPCASPGGFRAAGAVIDSDGTTAALYPFNEDLVAEAGVEAADENDLSDLRVPLPLERVGPWQALELAVWNGCPKPILAQFELTNLLTREAKSVNIEVQPNGIGVVIPITPSAAPVHITGFGTFTVRDRSPLSELEACLAGQEEIAVSQSLVEEDGDTSRTTGLPTGKRRHHPITVFKDVE